MYKKYELFKGNLNNEQLNGNVLNILRSVKHITRSLTKMEKGKMKRLGSKSIETVIAKQIKSNHNNDLLNLPQQGEGLLITLRCEHCKPRLLNEDWLNK